MKILFITGTYPKGTEDMLQKKYGAKFLQIASNTYQWAITEGLAKNKADFSILSYPFLPCYPLGFNSLMTPSMDFEFDGKKIGIADTYCSLLGLKSHSIKNRIQKYVQNWVEENNLSEEPFAVMTYTPCSDFVASLAPLKKRYKKMIICTIVTDLIDEFFNPIYKRSLLKRIQGRREFKSVHSNYKFIDKFILLSKSMEEKIPEAVGRNIVVEGVHLGECMAPVHKTDVKKSLLYTGALATHSCMNDLVDAFMLTKNPDFQLIICGGGTLKDYVEEKSQEDSRIVYKGMVPRDEAIRLQKEATAVINPRKPTVSLTKYSFPSKTMEYLASGTPMIGYRLQGIPDEYYDYLFTVENLDNESLANTIDEVLSAPDNVLYEKSLQAIEFIEKYKNSEYQVKRILDFLEAK